MKNTNKQTKKYKQKKYFNPSLNTKQLKYIFRVSKVIPNNFFL